MRAEISQASRPIFSDFFFRIVVFKILPSQILFDAEYLFFDQ